MQIIELAPARRTSVYAVRRPDGSLDVTHAPAARPEHRPEHRLQHRHD